MISALNSTWGAGMAQCGPGSIPGPGVTCGLSLLLVLVLAPRVFLRVFRCSSPTKINTSRSPSQEPATTPYSCHGVFTDLFLV